MRDQSPPQLRPKAKTIQTIKETAPWVLVVQALKESGLPEKEIRERFKLRRFGNADYVSPVTLNHWILTGEETQTGDLKP